MLFLVIFVMCLQINSVIPSSVIFQIRCLSLFRFLSYKMSRVLDEMVNGIHTVIKYFAMEIASVIDIHTEIKDGTLMSWDPQGSLIFHYHRMGSWVEID